MRRDDKLLLLGIGVYLLTVVLGEVLVGDREPLLRAGLLLLFVPAHLALLRRPPERWLAWPLIGAATTFMLGSALVRGRSSLVPGGEYLTVLDRRGWLGLLGTVVLLAIPAWHLWHAGQWRYAPVRRTARAGMILLTAVALAAAVRPLLHQTLALAAWLVLVSAFYGLLHRLEQEYHATPVKRRQRLSATIITKNEADRIGRCLESVRWVDEIIVLDSGSTDGTPEICRRYTDHVHVTDWPGYGPQKQRALEKATGDWVLSIDADEEVTPELRHDIEVTLDERPDCVGYKLPWGVVVYGQMLDFGRSARAPLRLFQRQGTRFTDAQVHETVILPEGRVGTLRGRLLHYTHRDFPHALQKSAHYAWLGARQRQARGKRGGGLLGALLRACIVFVQVYVVRLGFLDGGPGFLVAATYTQTAFNKYAGLWALRRAAKSAAHDDKETSPSGTSRGGSGSAAGAG